MTKKETGKLVKLLQDARIAILYLIEFELDIAPKALLGTHKRLADRLFDELKKHESMVLK